jgi:hypothetical protein
MRPRRLLLWLTLWSTAFGACEGAVVVYLRRLCYPGQPDTGPLFPLRLVDPLILHTEVLREAATILMLFGVAFIAERRPLRRFAVFAFCFGVWDVVYYLALYALLGWPASLMDWDVLFLIPAPWAAPVLAPVLVSLGLVGGAAVLLARVDDVAPSPFRPRDWSTQGACGAVILWSFLWSARAIERSELPHPYPWWLFLAGWLGGLCAFTLRLRTATR